MGYSKLAMEFMQSIQQLHKMRPHKGLDDVMRREPFVLQFIHGQGGEVLPGDIRAEMCVSTARIAQTLNNMEKKEWITREIDPEDRRRILVRLTPKGQEVSDEHRREVIKKVSGLLEQLGESDATELIRIMAKVARLVSDNADCE